MRNRDDLFSRTDTHGHQCQFQCVCSALAGNRIPGPTVSSEIALKILDVRPPNETGLVDNFFYGRVDLIANFSMLLGKVDKRNFHDFPDFLHPSGSSGTVRELQCLAYNASENSAERVYSPHDRTKVNLPISSFRSIFIRSTGGCPFSNV